MIRKRHLKLQTVRARLLRPALMQSALGHTPYSKQAAKAPPPPALGTASPALGVHSGFKLLTGFLGLV